MFRNHFTTAWQAILIGAMLAVGPVYGESGVTGGGAGSVGHPIVSGFLIGGSKDGKWLKPEETVPLVAKGEHFRVWAFDESLGEGIGSAPEVIQGPGEYDTIDIERTDQKPPRNIAGQARADTVAVAGDWNVLPRPAKIQTGGLKPYEDAIQAILKKNKITVAAPKPSWVVRADLDGDKEDEVVVVSSNADARIPEFRKNTHCLAFLRKVVKGKVETTVLAEEYYRETKSGEANSPIGYELPLIMDLNGDGKMEIILHGFYYEGEWFEIWEIQGDKPVMVLHTGVGA